MRERWGCDGDAADVLYDLPCWTCDGRSADCATCNGTGLVEMRRCPGALTEPAAARAVEAAQLVDVGILPVSGGWRDQAALFVDAVRIIAGHRQRFRKEIESRGKSGS